MAVVAVRAPDPDPTVDVDLAAVLEALPDGVVVIDPEIRVVWVNARFRALTGWTLAELVGRSGLELLDPEQLTAALDALSIVREAPHLLPPGAYRLAHRDGGYVNLELHAAPIDPDDPASLTAMMARPVEYQTLVTEGIELLNADGPIEDMAGYIVHRIGWTGGAIAIAFDDDVTGDRRSVHADLPAILDGTTKPDDGLAPWDEVLLTGDAIEYAVDDLPPSVRRAAIECGFVACTAEPVPDPGGRDAVIVLWFRADASAYYRFLFREEPRYLLLRLALERRHYQHELRRAATQDHLTGLANRARFFESLAHVRAGRAAVLYLDLDDFKPVNDTYGHLVGDAVLAEVGRRLRVNTRHNDVAARLGGDEFAVYCPDLSSVGEAEALAQRIHDAVTLPLEMPEVSVRVGATIGVAVTETGAVTPGELVDAADRMLYALKRDGKDGWRLETLT